MKDTKRLSLKMSLFLVLVLLSLSLNGIVNASTVKAVQKTPVKAKKPITAKTFTLVISSGMKGCFSNDTKASKELKGKILLKKVIKIVDKKNALTYLKENTEVVESGGFIEYINKLESYYPIPSSKMSEEMKNKGVIGVDWFIYVNNNKSMIGASQIIPKNGDTIMFDYHYWNKDEFNQNKK